MNNYFKKILRLIMAFTIVFSTIPGNVSRAEAEATEPANDETVYVAEVAGTQYATLAEAVTAANTIEGNAVVSLLANVTLGEELSISNDVTIDGDGHTITRADSYTGSLFTVETGATLTLDGNLTIDGGNEWMYKRTDGVPNLKTVVENYSTRVGYSAHEFIDYESGAPTTTDPMFEIGGSVVINDVTVQNNVSSSCILHVQNGGVLTTNKDAVFTHNAGGSGAIVVMKAGSKFDMNGSTMSENVGGNHGGCVFIDGGTMTMNGGLVEHNHTTGHASFVRLNGGKFIMNDGEIRENAALPFGPSGNNAGGAIDVTRQAQAEINGGTIQNNFGYMTGGINHVGTSLTITGGTIVDNTAWAQTYGKYNNDIFYASTDAKPAVISGGIFGTEIYSSCTNTDPQKVQAVTPEGYEEFVIGTDADGNPNLWEVAPAQYITFQDESSNELQYGPVREGTIPVFNGEVEAREGYVWTWDKELAPAVEPATYTLTWKEDKNENGIADELETYVCWNMQTGVYYTTVSAGLEEANVNETIQLLASTSDNEIQVNPHITLDLNGWILTANYVVGLGEADVIDNTRSGLLIVDQENIVLDSGNSYVPVWNAINGYRFTQLIIADLDQGMGMTTSGDTATCKFVTFFRDTDLLTDGVTDNDLSVIIRMSWIYENETLHKDFLYSDSQVGTVVSANGKKAFQLTFTGCEDLNGLRFTAMVLSETGAEFCGHIYLV